jgi:hypothetical protein
MVIAKTLKGTAWIGAALFNSKVYKYAKNRGVWYYRLLLSQQFSDVIMDIYDMNRLEKKLNPDAFASARKKVFTIDERGRIYDDKTGEIFGTMGEAQANKFDTDTKEDEQEYKDIDDELHKMEEEAVKPKKKYKAEENPKAEEELLDIPTVLKRGRPKKS